LESNIDAYIKSLRQSGYLSSAHRTSFVVYDILHNRKVASINEDEKLMAASTVKIFVMLAYFDQVKEGRMKHTDVNRALLRRMIQSSDNAATNILMNKLRGPRRIERL